MLKRNQANLDGLTAYNFIKLAFEPHSIQRIEQLSETGAQNNSQITVLSKISPFFSEAQRFQRAASLSHVHGSCSMFIMPRKEKKKRRLREQMKACVSYRNNRDLKKINDIIREN